MLWIHTSPPCQPGPLLTGPQGPVEAMPFCPGLYDSFPSTALSLGSQAPIPQDSGHLMCPIP